jgi:hypothetical protein
MADRKQIVGVVGLISGIGLFILGATWTYWRSPQHLWTRQQANEYTDAWRALKIAATGGIRPADPGNNVKLAEAQARFDAIKAKLDRATVIHEHTGTALVGVGAVIAAACVWYLVTRNRSEATQ